MIGQPIEDLDTPALLLHGPTSDQNLRYMADYFAKRSCKLRPHFKNHKCTTLARRQLEAGSAVGITCAKLAEAEVLVENGVQDVLVANQVVGQAKVQRLAAVAGRAKLACAVDDLSQAQAISRAAVEAGSTVGLLVEVDIGMGRCGVGAGEPALELTRQITELPGVEFRGLQAYEGHCVYVDDVDERRIIVTQSMQLAADTRKLIEQNGIEISVISGGSSSTYKFAAEVEGVREIQAGSYATMDWRYNQLVPEFDVALTVLVTVISRPKGGAAVLDIGVKGVGAEFGNPRVKDHPEADIASFHSEEHTVVSSTPNWRVGDKIQLLSAHGCTTCNLHRQLVVHDGQRVVDVWPIEGSGRQT